MSRETKNQCFAASSGSAFAVLLHNVLDITGSPITKAFLKGVHRTVTDPSTGISSITTLTVGSVVFDTSQVTTLLWNKSYNFKDEVPFNIIGDKGTTVHFQYTFIPTLIPNNTFKSREFDITAD